MPIDTIVPEANDLLALGTREVGEVLLVYLNGFGPNDSSDVVQRGGDISRHNFFNWRQWPFRYPSGYQTQIEMKLAEGWDWLVGNGFLVTIPTQPAGWFRLTEKGKAVNSTGQIAAYRLAGSLHGDDLHPIIRERAYPPFLRGDYDGAIRDAFIELEARIRTSGGYEASDYGASLIKKAFDTSNGKFVDRLLPTREREAMRDLFAAAFGFYRNPRVHRRMADSAIETAEIVGFASHLMRIVERLTP